MVNRVKLIFFSYRGNNQSFPMPCSALCSWHHLNHFLPLLWELMLSSIANLVPSELLATKKLFQNEECILQANILAPSNTSQKTCRWNKNLFLFDQIHWFILRKHSMSVKHANTINGHLKWQEKIKTKEWTRGFVQTEWFISPDIFQ